MLRLFVFWLGYFSEESFDSLSRLSNFSRKNREQENDDQMRAGGGAAAPVRRHQYYSSDSDGGYSNYIRR